MKNLLDETIEVINNFGYSLDDIVFIGSSDGVYSCTWEEFTVLADREYDSGYGSQEVATDLIIVFKEGCRMMRVEYDGAEKWECIRVFKSAEQTRPIHDLFSHTSGYSNLANINREYENETDYAA